MNLESNEYTGTSINKLKVGDRVKYIHWNLWESKIEKIVEGGMYMLEGCECRFFENELKLLINPKDR